MTVGLALLLGLAAGVGLGWLLARRGRVRVAPGVAPHLLPDPALGWLRRLHGAIGVWVTELDPQDEGPRTERLIDAERLSVAEVLAVDRRLERARDGEQRGVERLESGTLVFHGAGGAAVGLLLAPGHDAARLRAAEEDLGRLLEGVRRRPQIVALVQAQAEEASLESAGSVGLRLAYQLERSLGSEVVVAARDAGGVRVIGVSGRGDRRLMDLVLPPGSELARVAAEGQEEVIATGDPFGGAVADRRQRAGPVLLVPIRLRDQAVGAVAVWLVSGLAPSGAARTEFLETLASAAPRIARALEADRAKQAATVDPLTSLCNRRGLEEILARHGPRRGALIFADLDRFKLLNDTLGHPAGDAALVHFARILREQIRGGDTAARVGGEEFAVWLPESDLELGVRIADRVRVKLGTTPWDWRGRAWPLTASFGVAACPETSRSPENLLPQADAALYGAKQAGRNRVERAARAP